MKLSIAMIVKNEEKNLERTLIPLKELQKYINTEIIIVDTGSTDSTVEIARKYTDKVYFHKWNNDFADMRNISINYCTGEWILVVDADEMLYDVEELVNLLKDKNFNKHNGACVKIINYDKDIESSINNGYISSLLRLFKKGNIKYQGIVHEQPICNSPITDTNIRFIHYGYDSSDYELMEYKFKRNLELLFKQLKNDPDNIYVNFQIAVSYIMHKDLSEALKYIEIAYSKAKSKGKIDNYIYVLDKYCLILFRLKDYYSLLDKVKEGIKYYDNFMDFYFYLGGAYYNLNMYDEAIKAYNKYLYHYNRLDNSLSIPNPTLSILTRAFKDNVLYNLSICYYKNYLYEKAIDTIPKVEDKNMLKDRAHIILKIIVEGKLWNKVHILNGLIDKYNYENILFYVHKELLIEDLMILNENKLEGNLKEIISIIKCFKENSELSEEFVSRIKKIIDESKIPYSSYLYYALKYDINEIRQFMIYGKDKIENVLVNLCSNYFDFNDILIKGLKKIECNASTNVVIRTIMKRALLLSGNLPLEKKKNLFLSYVAEKYYCIVKSYNRQLVEESPWMLSSEDRFVIALKSVLEYKYEDTLEYIKSMKDILNLEKSYIDYIKILIEEENETVNNQVKALIPELVKNIEGLINNERYQEAYNTIEEGLALIKFDFDLMVLKYKLISSFNYEKDAKKCLIDIILYGDSEKVIELVNNL